MFKIILESIMKKKLLFVIIAFCVLVVGITLGSAIITRTINIGGHTKIENNWIIYFDDVMLNQNSVKNTDTSEDARIVDPDKKQNIEFSANLSSVGDFYEFDVYTVNDGNIDAMIDSVELTGIPDQYKDNISYTVVYDDSDITSNDTYYSDKYNDDNHINPYSRTSKRLIHCDYLYGITRRKIRVTVKLEEELDVDSLSLNLKFKINYVQLSDGCVVHTLTIDPNGGKYNGSSRKLELDLTNGSTYDVVLPTNSVENSFLEWEVVSPKENGTYTFADADSNNKRTFTMGNEDVEIQAKWNTINYVASIGMCEFYSSVQDAYDKVDDFPSTSGDLNNKKLYKNYKCNTSDNTVYLLKDHTESPNNTAHDAFKFDLMGHTLTGTITNGSESKTSVDLTLVNGKVISTNDGNEAVTNYGILTMGKKDNLVNVENSITLIGNINGLVNKENSKFYFYDGYIENNKKNDEIGQVIQTTKSDLLDNNERIFTETGYHITIDPIDNDGKRAYLIPNSNRRIAKTTTLGEFEYYNLQIAIDEVEAAKKNQDFGDNDYVIYATRDFEAAYEIKINNGSRIFFDTKGFDIKLGENLINNGYFKIEDSTDNNNNITLSKTITNKGTLDIDKLLIKAEGDSDVIENNGQLNLTNTTISSKKGVSVYNKSGATVTLDSDSTLISEDNYSLFNESSKLMLDDGTVYGLYNKSTANITGNVVLKPAIRFHQTNPNYTNAIYNTSIVNMTGGVISSNLNIDLIYNTGTFNYSDGTINSSYTAVNNTGTFNVNGSEENEIFGANCAISGGTVNVNSGIVSSNNIAIDRSTVNVNGGTVTSDNIAINEGTANIYSGLITSNNAAIRSYYVNVSGGQITGKNNGIISYYKLNMVDGEVSSTDGIGITTYSNAPTTYISVISGGSVNGGTYAIANHGLLDIGINDGTISTIDSETGSTENATPQIIGDLYGLSACEGSNESSSCLVSFYDGVIKGKTGNYSGDINNTPSGAFVSSATEGDYEIAFLSIQEDWLKVGDETFKTIDAASQAIESTGTIEVIKDANITFKQTFLDEENSKTITFDLNGHTISTTQSITNQVNLTIIDSDTNENGTINFFNNSHLYNRKNLTLNGGNYIGTTPIANNLIMVVEKANFNVTYSAIYNANDLTINGINVISSKNGIVNSINDIDGNRNGYSITKFYGGIISADENGIYNTGLNQTDNYIYGGEIIGNKNGIFGGEIFVRGGKITGYAECGINTQSNVFVYAGTVEGVQNGIDTQSGTILIDGGVVKGNIAITTTAGNVNINDGSVIGQTGGIYTFSGSLSRHVIINGGTITGGYGLKSEEYSNANGHIYIAGGTITGTSTYGVTTNVKNIEIGVLDDEISTEIPTIIGKTIGLNIDDNCKNVYFYDGILKGINKAHNGLITKIPLETMIKGDYEFIDRVEYKTEYLTSFGNWLRVGNQEFSSIDAAQIAAGENGVMTVIADPYISFEQTIFPSSNVTLDLNGHSLTITYPITNEGNFSIIDSSVNGDSYGGGITNLNDYAIINKGELTLNRGSYKSEKHYALKNYGTLTMNYANINSYNGVYNSFDATFKMNDGEIKNINKDSIISYGITTINGGTIESSSSIAIESLSGTLTINDGIIKSADGTAIKMDKTDDSSALVEYHENNNGNPALPNLYINGGYIFGGIYGIIINNIDDNEIMGGVIESDGTGITTSQNTLITGGTIYGKISGVNSSYDILTLGKNDGTVSNTSPKIKGDTYAISKTNSLDNILQFYDGILIGITDTTNNDVNEIATNTNIIYGTSVEENKTYKTATLNPEIDLVYNTYLDKTYINLQTAIDEINDDISDEEVLIILNDAPLYYPVTNNKTKAFKIDMNGHSLSTNTPISNSGNLEIINTSDTKSKITSAAVQTLVLNTGDLKIDNVDISNTISTNEYLINNSSILRIDNSNITSKNCVKNTSQLTINNSKISAVNTAIRNSGPLTINQGTYESDSSYVIYSDATGGSIVNISNASFKGIVYNTSNNVTTISNSRLNSNIQNHSNNMTINSSEIYGGTNEGILNYGSLTLNDGLINKTSASSNITAIDNSGTININNSNINIGNSLSPSSTYTYYGILNTYSGISNLDNSNINIQGGYESYGIYLRDTNSKATLKTGSIRIENGTTSYGVYIKLGTFTMGYNETGEETINVSRENPMIYSYSTKGTGVKRINGEFNFYDGEIWATKYSKPETTTNVPINYETTMYVDEETGYEYCHLEYMPDDYEHDAVAILNDVYYLSVQSAINASEDGDVIKMLRSTTESLEVPSGKSIVINLNKHSITTNTDTTIGTKVGPMEVKSGGTLVVYDGSLQSFDNTAVINNGTFIMGVDDENVSSTNVRIVSEVTAIENNGTFIMYDGYLEGNPSINGQINQIANFSRIYTTKDEQSEKKYLQSLSEEAIRNKETDLILTIDPNNGYYEDSKDIKNVYLKFEDEYSLSIPTKNGCIFTGWQVSVSGVLNDNTITMGVEDIVVTAIWDISPTAVAHIGDEYYESLMDAVNAAKENDEIILLKDIAENIIISNDKNVIINLNEYKVTGEFINNGTLKLLNGTIENTNGIGLVNNKTLTLGENDEQVSEDSVKIIGTSVGLEQNGRLNIYDGYLEGDIALSGGVTSVPQGYYIYTAHNNDKDCQRVYLMGNPANAVAIIDSGTTQYFFNLQDAINVAATINEEILIVRDFEGAYPISIPENTTIEINMQSHDITLGNTITNNGTLKIYDLEDDKGSISIVNEITNTGTLEVSDITISEMASNRTINNSGHLKLDSAKITSTSATTIYTTGTMEVLNDTQILSDSKYGISNNQEEKLTINSGIISGIYNYKEVELDGDVLIKTTSSSTPGIYLPGNATFIMKNGTIETTNCYGIYFTKQNNNITIDNGNINSKKSAIYSYDNTSSSILTINDGEITSTSENGIYIYTNETQRNTFNMTGGKVTGSTHGVFVKYVDMNMTGGELITTSTGNGYYALYCSYRTDVNISNGAKITSENASGIYLDTGTSKVTLEDAIIDVQGKSSYGVRVWQGTLNIKGNTIITTTGISSYGAYLEYDSVTLNMDSGEINSNNIGISTNSSRNNTKKININGGRIIGSTYGIQSNISNAIFNIGNSDDELSTTIPYISGGTYGIYKTAGTVNFYNGRLRGATYGYYDELNAVRRGKDIVEELEYPDYTGVLTHTTTNTSNSAISEYAKKGNGYAKITYIGETNGTCENGTLYSFDYTGSEQTLNVTCPGKYKLEVWGAQGGSANSNYIVGYGGYSYGEITLNAGEILYINIGGQGVDTNSNTGGTGGYNGGGAGGNGYYSSNAGGSGGGGATHIATSSGLLRNLKNNKESILIVAGGGGGRCGGTRWNGSNATYASGSGGGYIGGTGWNASNAKSVAGTQSSGAGFGYGSDGRNGYSGSYASEGNGGSGGGYYGGYTSNGTSGTDTDASGAGGSGYVGNTRLSNAYMYGYNVPSQIYSYMNNYLVEKDDFLQVGEETFNNFEDAIEKVETTGTIKVIKDETVQESATFVNGKTITLDLNGHTINMTTPITNEGSLIITDTTDNKTGKIINTASNAINNKANVTIEYVTIQSVNSVINAASGTGDIKVYNGATLNGKYGVYLNSAQHVDIDSSTITTTNYSIYASSINNVDLDIKDSNITSTGTQSIFFDNSSNSTVDIENTIISGTNNALYLYINSGTINITDGEISTKADSSTNYAASLAGSSTFTLDGVKLTSDKASGLLVSSDSAIVNLIDTEVTAKRNNSYGVYISSGTLNIDGNTNITTTGTSSYGIISYYATTINMSSGSINSNNIGITNSNRNDTQKVNIYGGKVIGTVYGIQSTISNMTINVGRSTDELSTTTPVVYGGKYGIYNTAGTVNFYNGVLKSKIFGYYKDINNVRSKKSIYTEYVEEDDNFITYSTRNVSSSATSDYAKSGNGYARLTYLGETNETCTNGQIYNFDYTGSEQEFNVDCEGNYKIEVWGAQGGSYNENYFGGYGGYAKGNIELIEGETLYINVGGQGSLANNNTKTGGYNGGGNARTSSSDDYAGSGGGATHIATSSGLLSSLENNKESVLIVAGGGGGAYYHPSFNSSGGSGGGYVGGLAKTGLCTGRTLYEGNLASQTSSGKNNGCGIEGNLYSASFGQGGSYSNSWYSGGGSGYYGGGFGYAHGANGGSGYTSSTRLTNGIMYGYDVTSSSVVNNYLVEKDGFLKVGDVIYNSINDAVAAIESTGTIEVINDGIIQEKSIITSGKNITIDLNGHTLNMTTPITNEGSLIITDTTDNKTGKIINTASNAINNKANVTIEYVTIQSVNSVINAASGTGDIKVYNGATLNGKYGVYLNSAQHVDIDSSTITTTNYSIYASNINNIDLDIKDSSISSTETSSIYIYGSSNSTVDIENTIISGTNNALHLYINSGTINITDGEISTIKDDRDYYAASLAGSSTFTLDGVKLTSDKASGLLVSSDSAIVNLIDTEVTAKRTDSYGVYISSGTLNIDGNTNITTTGTSSYGIISYYATTINMTSGSISSNNIGISTSNRGDIRVVNIYGGKVIGAVYGIRTITSNTTVNIGGEDFSITNPYIEGGMNGLYRTNGNINFYAGKLKGAAKAYDGDITTIRDGYEIYEDYEGVQASIQQTRTISTSNTSSEPLENTAKKGNGYAKITYISQSESNYSEVSSIEYTDSKLYKYNATKSEQSFVAPYKGKYKVELWGAQGGYRSNSTYGGKGAYVSGNIELDKDDELLVYVGSSGNNGSYNGGGTRTIGHGGGGATDIRLSSSLYSRIMVAAGGGSDGASNKQGGYGGALTGQSRTDSYGTGGEGATQTSGGSFNGDFGIGGDGITLNNGYGGAGGGGWYGGGGAKPDNGGDDDRGGGGGSSFVYNETATLPSGYLVDSKYMISDSRMYAGNENIPQKNGFQTIVGNTDDGYARITLLELDDDNDYTVKLKTSKGTIQNDTLTYSSGSILGDIPSPDFNDNNYEFDGWYLDENYTKKVTSNTIVKYDTELYAKFILKNIDECTLTDGASYVFDYTGSEQTFTAVCSGIYKLEVWGAQGGSYSDDIYGGFGGYSKGEIRLNKNETLYINVGGQGISSTENNVTISGGYNGGGDAYLKNSTASGSGGGATHIATSSGLLSSLENNKTSILIVAGGGGGSAYGGTSNYGAGGSGGGYKGANGLSKSNRGYGTGGTQDSGGYFSYNTSKGIGSFGKGANTESNGYDYYGGAGGGGFYGGGSSSTFYVNGGGGGSGYTANTRLYNTFMYGYNVEEKAPYDYANIAYLVKANNFVKNSRTEELYSNLQTAIDASSSGDTLELISNANVSYNITINSDDNIILDLKGYNLQSTKTIKNNGIFTIKNTDTNLTSKLYTNITMTLITNNGTLDIDNVTVQGTTTINNSTNGIYTINNSTIKGTTYAIYDSSTNTNTMSNSLISATTNAIYNYSTGTINSTNSNISGKIWVNNATGSINISGGTITTVAYNKGKLDISNATINYGGTYDNSYDYLFNNYGTLTLSNNNVNYNAIYSYYRDDYLIRNYSTLTSTSNTYNINENNNSTSRCIYNESIFTSTSDSIEIYNTRNTSYGIYNKSTSESNISNLTLNIHDNATSYGIYNEKGDLVINGSNSSINNSTTSYGLYLKDGYINLKSGTFNVNGTTTSYGIRQEAGEFTLGIEDGRGTDSADVSITDPHIEAISSNVDSGIGLSKTGGIFNFYDGYVIASKTPRDTGFAVSNIELNYQLVTKYDSTTGYNYCILEFIH